MARRAINPYYDDPQISAIASNITKAFVDSNPGQTAMQRQHARYYGLQADELQGKQEGRSAISGIFATLDPSGRIAPEQHTKIAQAVAKYGLNPKEAADLIRMHVANSGRPDVEIGNAVVGSGQLIGENQGVSVGDRENVARRADAARAQRSAIAAGPGYAAVGETRRNNEAKLKFEQENPTYDRVKGDAAKRFVDGDPNNGKALLFPPHNVARDGVAVFPDGDPRAYGPRIEGPQSPDRLAVVPNADSPTGAAFGAATPGAPAFPPASATPKPATPMDVNSVEVDGGVKVMLQNAGAIDSQWRMDSDFEKEFGDRLPAARDAYSSVYQSTRNAAAGERAFWNALGVPQGSKWQRHSQSLMSPLGQKGFTDPGGKPLSIQKTPIQQAITPSGAPAPAPAMSPPAASPPAAAGGLPPQAVSRLKEGVVTQFGNGQAWTLQNGKPVQVK